MNEKEWHEWRRQGIGGSDIGVLFGESQYCTQLELYRLKVGEIQPEPETDLARQGKWMERPILNWFENECEDGFEVIRGVMTSTSLKLTIENGKLNQSWMRANLDAIGQVNNNPVDIKFSSSNGWGKPGTDQVPVCIYYQMQWYIGIEKESEKAFVIKCDRLSGKIEVYIVKRNQEVIDNIVKVAYHFWHNHVLKKIPPKNTIYGTESINKKVASLRKINEQLKPLKKNKEELTAEIKEFMRQHEFLISPDSDKITKYTNCDKEKFDKDQFKLDYPDLYGQYVTKTKQRSLYA